MDYLLLVLLAVGIILAISLLITPAVAALLLVRTFEPVIILSAGFGVSAAVVGLYASCHLNVASGPAMALVTTAIFAGVSAVAAARR